MKNIGKKYVIPCCIAILTVGQPIIQAMQSAYVPVHWEELITPNGQEESYVTPSKSYNTNILCDCYNKDVITPEKEIMPTLSAWEKDIPIPKQAKKPKKYGKENEPPSPPTKQAKFNRYVKVSPVKRAFDYEEYDIFLDEGKLLNPNFLFDYQLLSDERVSKYYTLLKTGEPDDSVFFSHIFDEDLIKTTIQSGYYFFTKDLKLVIILPHIRTFVNTVMPNIDGIYLQILTFALKPNEDVLLWDFLFHNCAHGPYKNEEKAWEKFKEMKDRYKYISAKNIQACKSSKNILYFQGNRKKNFEIKGYFL
jgi:hypothetical protein